MSVEIFRTRADVCAAILADELNDFYDGSPFVEFVRIDDDVNITISYETAPSTQNETDLDTILAAHDCSLLDDEDTVDEGLLGNVLNNSGITIPNGYPIYLTGFDATEQLPTIAKADASSNSTMPSYGITTAAIDNGDIGIIITSGQLSGVDTSSFAIGDEVYVATGGGLITSKPTDSNLIQKVAQIQVSSSINGRMQVFGAGSVNDIPNITTNKVWMGDSNSVPQEVDVYTETEADVLLSSKANSSHPHTESDITDLQNYLVNISAESIKDLSDVFSTMTPTDGQVLTFDTTNGWQAETINVSHPDPHLLNDGSTSNPTYSFGADSDTGMYRESSGDLAFSNDGLCTLEIAANGRVFISGHVPTYETLVTTDNTIPNKKYVDDAISNSGYGIGDVTSALNLPSNCLIVGDDGAKGVKTSPWEILSTGTLVSSVNLSGYTLDVHNTKNDGGGNGFRIKAGEVLGDISFHVADQDDTFQIMELEADRGYATFGKTYAQTLIDNSVVHGIDIQHDTSDSATDFNTQHGTYKKAGVDVIMPPGGTTGQVLEKIDNTDYNTQWASASAPSMRPTFAIWAEESSSVSVRSNNYEYSFGNGGTNYTSNPSGIPMGVNCTLIAIGVSAVLDDDDPSSVSVSVTKNGSVVATGGIASGSTENEQIKNTTQITPDTVNFAVGDTLQFRTASETGDLEDVRVVAWFERTS